MQLVKTPPMPAVGREWNTVFDRLFRSPLFPDRAPTPAMMPTWEPALDLSETDTEYKIRLEAPGFHRENLDVRYDGQMLTIAGHRELRKETKDEDFLWQEREEGKFTRSIRLPKPVAEDRIDATYQNGVLVVTLPKAVPTPKARIAIK